MASSSLKLDDQITPEHETEQNLQTDPDLWRGGSHSGRVDPLFTELNPQVSPGITGTKSDKASLEEMSHKVIT